MSKKDIALKVAFMKKKGNVLTFKTKRWKIIVDKLEILENGSARLVGNYASTPFFNSIDDLISVFDWSAMLGWNEGEINKR